MAANGRYLISIAAAQRGPASDVVIHDTEHIDERCNTDEIKTKARQGSYFNDLDWALRVKGYRPCEHCMSWLANADATAEPLPTGDLPDILDPTVPTEPEV